VGHPDISAQIPAGKFHDRERGSQRRQVGGARRRHCEENSRDGGRERSCAAHGFVPLLMGHTTTRPDKSN
jgi:hypothetical protein